jgi:hypothetical protein
MLNDFGWFAFLFSFPPFTAWCVMIAVAILRDHAPNPLFPRWAGYLSIWAAVMLMPAGLMTFFKTGPMAYDGIIAFWIPTFSFLVWMIAMTVSMLRLIKRLERRSVPLAEPSSVLS